MARVPIKRGQTEDAIEHYYFLLEIRAQVDFDLDLKASHLHRWRPGDHPNYIKFCEYGRQGFEAAAAVVRPLNMVYNFIIRYHRNHTPWESFPLPTENHPILGPYEVYRCLQEISRENLELILKHFQMTNRQRDALLSSVTYGKPDDFVNVYGEMSNDQEVSNLCWELGLYHPEEDALVQSRLLEDPDIYYEYKEGTQKEDWAEIESGPITNLDVLRRVQYFYEVYCEGRQHLIEDDDIINKREKEIINEILMRPEGEIFRCAYESGKQHLIEYDAKALDVVSIKDYTLTSYPPFDSIDWDVKTPFPVGIAVPGGKSTSKPSAQTENQAPSEEVVPDDTGQDKPSKKKAGRNRGEWLSEKYSMYSDEQVGIELRTTLWPKLQQILAPLPLPNVGNSRTKGDLKSLGAALLFYVFKQLGIALENATYGRPFERTMVVMGAEEGKLMGKTFRAGPFARNSTKDHLAAVSKILPALCQLKDGKRIDISKLRNEGSPLEKALINGHLHLMTAYQYLIKELSSIFEGSSDNPTNDAKADSD
jgi:hypothetical protein